MKLIANGHDHTAKFRDYDRKRCRLESLCACTGILFFVPLVSTPESRYGRYWANQGLIVLLVEALCLIAGLTLSALLSLLLPVPVLGKIAAVLKVLVAVALWGIVLFYVLTAALSVLRGRAKDVPFIGYWRFFR